MLDSLLSVIGLEGAKSFFSDALQTEFTRTLTIFSVAAWVHSKQVRKEIRAQIGGLVEVLQKDLEGNKFLTGSLIGRVTKIEAKLGIGEQPKKE